MGSTIRRIGGVPSEKTTTVTDVSDHQFQKVESFRCNRSQVLPRDASWMVMEDRPMDRLATEGLVRVSLP